MSFTVFLGNLPTWVTADDIMGWLQAENLVADAIKVIRNPETQESKGFAFIESPNTEEMNSIIRRFDRAPLEDRLLRANPAQPPRPKGAPGSGPVGQSYGQGTQGRGPSSYGSGQSSAPNAGASATSSGAPSGYTSNAPAGERPPARRGKRAGGPAAGTSTGGAKRSSGPQSPFAEELAKVL
jgi:RNA recognition motif-containing protein